MKAKHLLRLAFAATLLGARVGAQAQSYYPPAPPYVPSGTVRPSLDLAPDDGHSFREWLPAVIFLCALAGCIPGFGGDDEGSGAVRSGGVGGSDDDEPTDEVRGRGVAPISPLYGSGPGGAFYGNDTGNGH